MSPEKLSEGTFGVSLSSSEGGFTAQEGSGKVDPEPQPETITGVSSSSGGCNSGAVSLALVILSALLITKRSRESE